MKTLMKEGVRDPLETQCEVAAADMWSLRTAYGETKTAIISLQQGDVEKLTTNGKLKECWVIFRIRGHGTAVERFRCLEFKHITTHCKSEYSKSKTCQRCA